MINSQLKTTLIITVYNQARQLDLVLKTVGMQTHMPDEIIIADDGSSDDASSVVDKWKAVLSCEFQYIWHEDVGFTKTIAQNKAIIAAGNEYLIFIDGDMLLHKKFIENHLRFSGEKSVLCGYRGVKLNNEFTLSIINDHNLIGNLGFFDLFFGKKAINPLDSITFYNKFLRKIFIKNRSGLSGGNFSIYKKNLVGINGFDEAIKEYGYEDYDLGVRLKKYGCKIINVSKLCVSYHLFHHSKKIEGGKKLREYFDKKSNYKADQGICERISR